jgi:hypothetical protein
MTESPQRPEGAAPPLTPPEGVPEALRLITDCQQTVIYKDAQRFLVRALALIAIGFGTALLLGGRARFESSPTFTYASAVPGSYRTWAVAAILVGAWTFAASFHWHRRHVMWGLLAQCVVFTFFAISIFASAIQDRTTPYTGIVIYAGYSLICAIAYVAGHELRKVRA